MNEAASKRVLYGAIAAFGAVMVALDASVGKPSDYPVLKKFFDGEWQVWHNLSLMLFSAIAAVFGYLTANVKG